MDRLIVDTGVLVNAERGKLDLLTVAPRDADAVIPAVVVAEFVMGVHMADSERRRGTRQAFLDLALRVFPVEDYTAAVAAHHGELLAHVRRSGRQRGAHDLIIAATARATERTIVTTDASAEFGELPGVTAVVVATK